MTFPEFFRLLWDRPPFRWQTRLSEQVQAGEWPEVISLPTAAGKTAIIDIAVHAMAMGAPQAPRRVFFVVDRRVIVDAAAERVRRIAERLRTPELATIAARLREMSGGEEPLEGGTLRGGIARDNRWLRSPLQPAVVCSTVDQVGSSLLFRGYGASQYAWPIQAGLAAVDSLIILDEAHCSQPFAETLRRIQTEMRRAPVRTGQPLRMLAMSATAGSPGGRRFEEEPEDFEDAELARRWTAPKVLRLADPVPEDDAVAQFAAQARALAAGGCNVVGVIVNRVRTAREVHARLSRGLSEQDGEAILLTGRSRPFDRDSIWRKNQPSLAVEQRATRTTPLYVVATQCIEVGADISFDGIVTELASLDALEQRLGRLARLGEPSPSRAVVVAKKEQIKKRATDPIYGGALPATWEWLHAHAEPQPVESEGGTKGRRKKRAVESLVPADVKQWREAVRSTEDLTPLLMPGRHAPILMPAHLDLLCQTYPAPALTPEPALFLHGQAEAPGDVEILWRADLPEERPELWADRVAVCPPSAAEAIAVPLAAAQRWLRQERALDNSLTDLEGIAQESGRPREQEAGSRMVLVWRGPDESTVETGENLGPGMRVVAPASYGGCDRWGWNPEATDAVLDIGDEVKAAMGRPILRLSQALARQYKYVRWAEALRKAEEQELRAALEHELWDVPAQGQREEGPAAWVKSAADDLRHRKRIRTAPLTGAAPAGEDDERIPNGAIFAMQDLAGDPDRSAYTGEITLQEHLAACARWAERFAAALPAPLKDTVREAAAVHDIGKADIRFQAWLRGGGAGETDPILAKSGRNGMDRAAVERARRLAGYPAGARHELQSVAMLTAEPEHWRDCDAELLRHLVASHHGRCRPFAPNVADEEEFEVSYAAWRGPTAHGLANVASAISERYWNLVARYGWYGLAYLEALVRLADWRCSEAEQARKEEIP